MDDLNKDNKVIYSPELHPKAILIVWICLGHFNTVIFVVCIKSGDATIPHDTEDAEQYAAIYCSYLPVYWYMDTSLHSIQNPSR